MTRRFRRLAVIAAVLASAWSADYWFFPLAEPAGRVVNHGTNGLWLHYTWAMGQFEYEEPKRLASRLKRNGIKDAYFHVRSIDIDGVLKYRYELKPRKLNDAMAAVDPKLRRIAWIYAGNSQGEGFVDLDNPTVRHKMVEQAVWLVDQGFDGVQWDYEICPDGDPNLLKLLDETRAALPAGKYLGAAVPTWYPGPLGRFGWSESYFGKVAQKCDGLAVMAYDSAMYTPRAYVWWVSEQVAHITKAVASANPRCEVTMGVPTYGDGTPSHNPHAENLRMALMGVRNGLASHADLRVWRGVALFADYTTGDAEWDDFAKLWPLDHPDVERP